MEFHIVPENVRRIFIRDLSLWGLVGVYDWEREEYQRLVVSVALDVEGVVFGDSIEEVVDYGVVVERIRGEVGRGHVHLVETLAERIGRVCLEDIRVSVVHVQVEKLGVCGDDWSVGRVGISLSMGRGISD